MYANLVDRRFITFTLLLLRVSLHHTYQVIIFVRTCVLGTLDDADAAWGGEEEEIYKGQTIKRSMLREI